MEEERVVSVEEGQRFAENHKLLFIETSAKTSVNVEEAFIKTSKIIYDKYLKGLVTIPSHEKDNGIRITSNADRVCLYCINDFDLCNIFQKGLR